MSTTTTQPDPASFGLKRTKYRDDAPFAEDELEFQKTRVLSVIGGGGATRGEVLAARVVLELVQGASSLCRTCSGAGSRI